MQFKLVMQICIDNYRY